jgi:hypothetical protein
MLKPMTDPDASGGLGSFKDGALGILTGIVQTVGLPYLAKELNLQQTTDAAGNVRYAGTPTQATGAEQAKSVLTSPLFLIGAAALVGLIIWRATR